MKRNKDCTLSPLPSPYPGRGNRVKLTQPVETHLLGRWTGQKMAETGSGDADGE